MTELLAGGLGRLAAVASERPRRGELAELVTHHVFRHVQLDEVAPVVDREVTNSGTIVQARAQVLIGSRFPDWSARYTFSSKRSTTYGPFFIERPMTVSSSAQRFAEFSRFQGSFRAARTLTSPAAAR
jgi:hypothetical protein